MSRTFEEIYSPVEGKSLNWRMISDQVMGGVSTGQVSRQEKNDSMSDCLMGNVSLENNGGFIQMQIDMRDVVKRSGKKGESSTALSRHFSDYDGIFIEVMGNNHSYNLHFKTSQLWFPWQAFRKEIMATQEWQRLFIPFREFDGYRTFSTFNPAKVSRFAIVAIGEAFEAKVCVRRLGVYSNNAV